MIALLALSGPTLAQGFLLAEISPLPASGDQIVEIVNAGPMAASLGGLNLCVQFSYRALPAVSVPSGGRVRVHVGVSGTNTAQDVFTGPTFPSLDPLADGVSLYKPGAGFTFFDNPANILDFVQYGAAQQPRSDIAVSAGIWPSDADFAVAPGMGQSLAWDGAGHSASNWFRDASPTLGAPNLGATAVELVLGPGCSASVPPLLDLVSVPALGNLDLLLSASGGSPFAPSLLIVGLGSAAVPVLQSCLLQVDTSVAGVLLPLALDSNGGLLLPVFLDDVALAGAPFALQLLSQPAQPASPKFDLSNGLLFSF